ncbi:MAG: hypothetical protein V1649_03965 [Patescibacteria group bacterium]
MIRAASELDTDQLEVCAKIVAQILNSDSNWKNQRSYVGLTSSDLDKILPIAVGITKNRK